MVWAPWGPPSYEPFGSNRQFCLFGIDRLKRLGPEETAPIVEATELELSRLRRALRRVSKIRSVIGRLDRKL